MKGRFLKINIEDFIDEFLHEDCEDDFRHNGSIFNLPTLKRGANAAKEVDIQTQFVSSCWS